MSDFMLIKPNRNSLTHRKLIHGVGINDADYMTQYKINGRPVSCPIYSRWKKLLERCYSLKFQDKNPTYKGCYMCDHWLVFSSFKIWMEKQDWKGKQLDKDLLIQGNKEYSPEKCIFVESTINSLLNSHKARRGKYPIGVSLDKKLGTYMACVSLGKKNKNIGRFKTPEYAHEAYKLAKYEIIKELAEKQVEPLRSALLAYKIK